jgi:adenylate cyclase
MVRVVMENGGAVDKYIGDAIMAVFGAVLPHAEDPKNAVRAAVNMRIALKALNVVLAKRGIAEIRTGIGIHTGEVVAGNIGSDQRMEYTVIGDAVNLASRLESSTKELHVDILISEATYERVKDIVEVRPVREIKVKGREQPVMTYEVLGLIEPAKSDKAG